MEVCTFVCFSLKKEESSFDENKVVRSNFGEFKTGLEGIAA
jgi:hypothetical protein